MFAAPPLGFIQDIRQQQKRLDWIQQFADVKGAQRGPFATGEEIDQIFAGTPLGDDARTEIVAAAAQLVNFNLRIGALEGKHGFFGERPGFEYVNRNRALLLRRRHGLVPFDAPRRLSIRSKAAAADGEGKEKC